MYYRTYNYFNPFNLLKAHCGSGKKTCIGIPPKQDMVQVTTIAQQHVRHKAMLISLIEYLYINAEDNIYVA